MPNFTTFILVFSFAYVHLCEMIFAILCLYFTHLDIGYESIVSAVLLN